MKVLIVGSGGREHALAWKIMQSAHISHVWVAPGNGGTALLGERAENIDVAAEDIPGLVAAAQAHKPDLTIVGPEVALALGLADELRALGLAVFGPGRAAAQIEASKTFAKSFMLRHGIPSARYAGFVSHDEALRHLQKVDYPVVIKASGLAAGKGVIVPETMAEAQAALRAIMVERAFGRAGDAVVIEERLQGPEVSLLAFCDGRTVVPMPPAQDHKRAFDGDQGPNTGGMGAFAPSPLLSPALLDEAVRTILQPAVDGLRAEGMPFSGVLYAGLMLTHEGPKVLEFNCRFGDPETQVLLPLLDGDLVDILLACEHGNLAAAPVRWKPGAAATVVLASAGYPGAYEKGKPISGLAAAQQEGVVVFHAGTRRAGESVLSSGGRVLNVSATDESMAAALARAYAAVEKIHFDGMFYRRDIGVRTGSR